MAKSGEHRMLFDIQGRRKRVVQVVYAMLAFIMAASLFFVVGPVNLDALIGNSSGSGSSTAVFDQQVQRLEHKLAKNPNDAQALAQLTRAHYNAGNVQIQRDPTTGQLTGIPQEAITEFNAAGQAWQRYLKADPKQPDPNVASLAGSALLYAAATGTPVEARLDVKAAAQAQAIYAAAKPSLNAYVTLAEYRYFAGDFKGGNAAGRQAEAQAPKSQQALVRQAIDQYRKQGLQIQKQIKAQSKVNPSGGQQLQNPLGGISGGGGGLGAPSPTP